MIGNDGELDSVARVQAVAAALNFGHVEEQLLTFVDLVIQEAKLTLDRVYNRAFLLANSSDLRDNKFLNNETEESLQNSHQPHEKFRRS